MLFARRGTRDSILRCDATIESSTMALQIGQPTDDTMLHDYVALGAQTFNFPLESGLTFVSRVGRENIRLATRGTDLAGGLAFYPLQQWFGGRPLPMAGIALVAIAPQYRGTGVSTQLLSQTLLEARQLGYCLSTLYPSTQGPYRKVGYEQAGHHGEHELSLRSIGRFRQTLDVRPVGLEDCTQLDALADERAQSSNGNLSKTRAIWERLFDPRGNATPAWAYAVQDGGQPQGYFVYLQTEHPETRLRLLEIRDICVRNRAAAETVWAFLDGHRSIYDTVRWKSPPVDPLLMLTAEDKARQTDRIRWMTRIVDVEQALRLRGYPAWVRAELQLEVRDELIPENNGGFVLRVRDGQADVARGGTGGLETSVSSLSPLFTSFATATALRQFQLIAGDGQSVAIADQIFGGPCPWMPDAF